MSTPRRPQKVAALIREELARILLEETSDPDLQKMAITEVKVSNDLKNAFVYFDHCNGEQLKSSIQKATPFFRKKIGQHVNLRHVPNLNFQWDTHGDSVHRLMQVLEDIHPNEGEGLEDQIG